MKVKSVNIRGGTPALLIFSVCTFSDRPHVDSINLCVLFDGFAGFILVRNSNLNVNNVVVGIDLIYRRFPK